MDAPVLRTRRSGPSNVPVRPSGAGLEDWVSPPFVIGAPGFEPGTSATRTQRSTGLSHAPESADAAAPIVIRADGVGFEPTRVLTHTISNRAP